MKFVQSLLIVVLVLYSFGFSKAEAKFRLRSEADILWSSSGLLEAGYDYRGGNESLDVAAELRSAYVLHYYTQVPPDGRWHDLKVHTIDPRYSVHARKGFFASAAK